MFLNSQRYHETLLLLVFNHGCSILEMMMNLIILTSSRDFQYPRISSKPHSPFARAAVAMSFLSAAVGSFSFLPMPPTATSVRKHTGRSDHSVRQLRRSTLLELLVRLDQFIDTSTCYLFTSLFLYQAHSLHLLLLVSTPPNSIHKKKAELNSQNPFTTNTYTPCSLSVPLPGLNELLLRSPPRGVSPDLALDLKPSTHAYTDKYRSSRPPP
jgi:hypothetical protein